MPILTVANVTLSFGERRILDEVSLSLERGDKMGLVGRNGCGKSTLMKLIAGILKPDSGQVQPMRGLRIGYMAQDHGLNPDHTLRREAAEAFGHLAILHDKINAVTEKMGHAEGDALEDLMKEYEKLEHQMQAAGGYAVDHKIDAVLHGLGLEDKFFEVKVGSLSGGQKARLALAKLLLSEPDLLLLDEPTNHLDIPGCQWLENFLNDYPGAILVISHDRWMLDEVVKKVIEVDHARLMEYPGNYQAYREQRELRRLEQRRVYDKQQTFIRQQKQYIDKYKTGQRAKEARGRQKKLDRFIRDETVDAVQNEKVMKLSLPPAPRSGDIVVTADELEKTYDARTLFNDFSLRITRGQKIGIIGPNGCGKSTLTNILVEKMEPDAGQVKLGSQLSMGYFDQNHLGIDPDDTPIAYLQRYLPETSDQSARDMAGAFLFTGNEQEKTLGVLSGGERARVVLAGLVMGKHNFLILDEPTNHLDIPSAEKLEEALTLYDGTMLLITHDRMLLEDTVEELLVFDGEGNIEHFFGKYSEYVRTIKERESAVQKAEADAAEKAAQAKKQADKKAKEQAKKQDSAPKKKKKSSGGKFFHLSDEQIEEKIMELESQLEEMDAQLADPELYKDHKAFSELQDQREAISTKLKPLEEAWLERME